MKTALRSSRRSTVSQRLKRTIPPPPVQFDLLTEGQITSNGTNSYIDTASVTPIANRPVVVFATIASTDNEDLYTISGCGLEWTEQARLVSAASPGGQRLWAWVGKSSAPFAGPIRISRIAGAGLPNTAIWEVISCRNTLGVASKVEFAGYSGTTIAATFAEFVDSINVPLVAFASSEAGTGMSLGAGLTQIGSQNAATGPSDGYELQLQAAYGAANKLDPSASQSLTNEGKHMVALEMVNADESGQRLPMLVQPYAQTNGTATTITTTLAAPAKAGNVVVAFFTGQVSDTDVSSGGVPAGWTEISKEVANPDSGPDGLSRIMARVSDGTLQAMSLVTNNVGNKTLVLAEFANIEVANSAEVSEWGAMTNNSTHPLGPITADKYDLELIAWSRPNGTQGGAQTPTGFMALALGIGRWANVAWKLAKGGAESTYARNTTASGGYNRHFLKLKRKQTLQTIFRNNFIGSDGAMVSGVDEVGVPFTIAGTVNRSNNKMVMGSGGSYKQQPASLPSRWRYRIKASQEGNTAVAITNGFLSNDSNRYLYLYATNYLSQLQIRGDLGSGDQYFIAASGYDGGSNHTFEVVFDNWVISLYQDSILIGSFLIPVAVRSALGRVFNTTINGNPGALYDYLVLEELEATAALTTVTDPFDRPDAVNLGSTPGGFPWIVNGGSADNLYGIVSNKARVINTAGNIAAWFMLPSLPRSNQMVVNMAAGTPTDAVLIRVVDANNYLQAIITESTFYLYKKHGGADSALTQVALASTAGVDYTVKVEVIDGVIIGYRNDVVILSYSLNDAERVTFLGSAAKGVGFRSSSTGSRHNDLVATY